MKEPVIERKINQLRDGSLNRKLGSPVTRSVRAETIYISMALPIIVKAGLRGGCKGFGAATASWMVFVGFSAMLNNCCMCPTTP